MRIILHFLHSVNLEIRLTLFLLKSVRRVNDNTRSPRSQLVSEPVDTLQTRGWLTSTNDVDSSRFAVSLSSLNQFFIKKTNLSYLAAAHINKRHQEILFYPVCYYWLRFVYRLVLYLPLMTNHFISPRTPKTVKGLRLTPLFITGRRDTHRAQRQFPSRVSPYHCGGSINSYLFKSVRQVAGTIYDKFPSPCVLGVTNTTRVTK